jgi:hypothetical protein
MMADSEIRPSAVELMDRIEWSTRPAMDTRFRVFSDSNGRTNTVRRSAYTHRFDAPVDLWFSHSDSTFRETGLDQVTARELGAGLRVGFSRGVEVELEAVRRNFNRVQDTSNVWLRMNLLAPGGQVQLALSREDLDTVRALEDGIQTVGGSALYRFSAGSLLDAQVRASTRSYDDGNNRRDVRATWTYQLKDREGWRVGGLVEASDSLFRSLRYYTPRAYVTGQGRVLYQRQWMGWVMEGNLGLGIATDRQIGGRIVHNGQFGLNQTWGEQLRANVQFAYSRVPGYQSMSLQAGVEFVIK